ncbi:MAG: leucyl aminopeptidase, partial [Cellulomonadaceae bacterium]|nr:leucyl aminopeptidase [Cellulomonadaceae bacterium]
MADLTLSANNPSTVKAEALVIASAITPDGLSIATQQLPDEFVATIEKLAVPLGITGAADEIRRLPAVDGIKAKTVVVTGLGKPQDDGTFG